MVERKKTVKVSNLFHLHLRYLFDYGEEVFGTQSAEKYIYHIYEIIDDLGRWCTLYPECRYLRTKGRIYRNLILDSYLIIYRIKPDCVEVLDIVRSESSIKKVRGVRKVRL